MKHFVAEANTSRINPLQLINGLREEVVHNDTNRGLMVIMVWVHGREVQVMLDTRATNNFLASHEVSRLGLAATAVGSKVKAVNAVSMGVQGVTIYSLRVGA